MSEKVEKSFSVGVAYSRKDGCGEPQVVTEGDIRRRIEGLDVENLRVVVSESGTPVLTEDRRRGNLLSYDELNLPPSPWRMGDRNYGSANYVWSANVGGKYGEIVADAWPVTKDRPRQMRTAVLLAESPSLYRSLYAIVTLLDEQGASASFADFRNAVERGREVLERIAKSVRKEGL